jgi:hypothetical protein
LKFLHCFLFQLFMIWLASIGVNFRFRKFAGFLSIGILPGDLCAALY